MKFSIHTHRLLLREFISSDAAFILELLNSPGWIEFIGDRGVNSIEQAEQFISNRLQMLYREVGFGLYLVQKKENAMLALYKNFED